MATITEAAHREFVTEHSYHFDRGNGSGWAFDSNAQGEVICHTDLHRQSLATARAEVAQGIAREIGHRVYTRSYWVEATLRCDCGTNVILYDPLYNECERCKRGYNLSGQSLAPISQWEPEDQEAVLYAPDPAYYREAY